MAQGSGERVLGAMQPESTLRPKHSLLAKTLCLVALLGAGYLLATGTPNMVTGAFSAAVFGRPALATPDAVSRAADMTMAEGGGLAKTGRDVSPFSGPGYYENMLTKQSAERAANLAKAEEQRLAFKQRNPDNAPLPGFLPFGEKMAGGRDQRR